MLDGFSQTHLSGVGRAEMGDVLLLPFVGEDVRRKVSYSHENEIAEPGYYAVSIDDGCVRAEITSTERVAFHRYTYSSGPARLLVDLQHGLTSVSNLVSTHVLACDVHISPDARQIEGTMCVKKNWPEHSYSFVVSFDRPYVSLEKLSPEKGENGPRYALGFDVKPGEVLQVKVALSMNSPHKALDNLCTEVPGWNFDEVRAESARIWESLLSRVRIKTDDLSLKRTFYTALYHSFLHPDDISDADESPHYSTFSLWDTFRAVHPLYTLLVPERIVGFVSSLLRHYREFGSLPIWGIWGKEGHCMIGNHAVPVLCEAWQKGFEIDKADVFQAVCDSLLKEHKGYYKEDWQVLDDCGYYPFDLIGREGVSRTYECAYDAWCAAQLAKELGKTKECKLFLRRSDFWRNVFDGLLGFARGKDSAGKWRNPFDPSWYCVSGGGSDFTEANAWQYSFHVLHDVPGMVEAFGGRDAFLRKLDALFAAPRMGKRVCRDATGTIGQYAHGNEPCHHIPYLYALMGERDKTVRIVDRICKDLYKDTPDGLCGNDDCGQLSAWYVFATLGFYPYNPASGEYVSALPRVSEYEIDFGNGRMLRCRRVGTGRERVAGSMLKHNDLVKGGELAFEEPERRAYENPVWPYDSPDPTIWQGGSNAYYASSTAQQILVSTNLVDWTKTGRRLLEDSEYEWISRTWPHVWAPDVVKIGEWYNLYVSFHNGGEHTAIACYRSKNPSGPFVDRKIVIRSEGNGRHEVIDPEVVVDEETGNVWLYFGHGDVRRVRLTADGREQLAGAAVEHVAGIVLGKGPLAKDAHEGIQSCEGAYLYKRGRFWYLFCSIGGWQTPNYRVLVGRSPTLDGVFYDRENRPLADGYGTVILRSDENDDFFGPGHNGEIFTTASGRTFMFYHCHWKSSPKQTVGTTVWQHSGEYVPRPLFVQEIFWDNGGWPYFGNGGKPQRNCIL